MLEHSHREKVAELIQRLESLSPRSLQILHLRVLGARPLHDCAQWFGISRAACERMFLRASGELASQSLLGMSELEEREMAARLHASFEKHMVPNEPVLHPLYGALQALFEHRLEVQAERERLAQIAENSPASHRRELLRKIAIGVVIAVSVLLYLRQRS